MRRAENNPAGTRKACCMLSEILEEAGLDREQARALRRQLLQGVMLMCQWQLERMQANEAAATEPPASATAPGNPGRTRGAGGRARARRVSID
jgi:hypothetical protein